MPTRDILSNLLNSSSTSPPNPDSRNQINAVSLFLKGKRSEHTTQSQTQNLVCSHVLSRIDYCNSLLSGCPQYLLDTLQKVQNAAARLVCKAKKSDHIHPILKTLHWLPVTHRIQYKISTVCFNSISGTTPQYLPDPLQLYTPARQLRSASSTRTFVTSCVNTVPGWD